MKKTILLFGWLICGSVSGYGQWAIQLSSDTRTVEGKAGLEAVEEQGTSIALERGVSFFIPFMRLSARLGGVSFTMNEDILNGAGSVDVIGKRESSIRELNGTLFAGIPLGSWLRVYAGYGWVYESLETKLTSSIGGNNTDPVTETNFGFAQIYGARIYLGKTISVNYEIRSVEYEKELPTNATARSSFGVAIHF